MTPSDNNGIQWQESLAAARAHATEHNKNVFTYIHAPG